MSSNRIGFPRMSRAVTARGGHRQEAVTQRY